MTPDHRAALRKLLGMKLMSFYGGRKAAAKFGKRLAKQKTQRTDK